MRRIWEVDETDGSFSVDCWGPGRFERRAEERRIRLFPRKGLLHAEMYDRVFRVMLSGRINPAVQGDTLLLFETQFGQRRVYIGHDLEESTAVDDALEALAVWLDALKETGAIESW